MAAALWVFLAKKKQVPIVFSNVGFGGTIIGFESILIKYALINASGISLRDLSSLEKVKKMAPVESKAHIGVDIVFYERLRECHIKPDKSCTINTLIGITSLNVYNTYNSKIKREDYYQKWVDFAFSRKIPLDSINLIYADNEDYIETCLFSDYIYKRFGCKIKTAEYHTLFEFEEILKSCSNVISGRMHTLILALNNGCKVEPFPISPKLENFDILINEKSLDELAYLSEVETKKFLSRYLS